jgi:hypothetical protein
MPGKSSSNSRGAHAFLLHRVRLPGQTSESVRHQTGPLRPQPPRNAAMQQATSDPGRTSISRWDRSASRHPWRSARTRTEKTDTLPHEAGLRQSSEAMELVVLLLVVVIPPYEHLLVRYIVLVSYCYILHMDYNQTYRNITTTRRSKRGRGQNV